MRASTSLSLAILFTCFSLRAQEFRQYTGLRKQAYAAFREKNYQASAEFFEKAFALRANQKPESWIRLHYDLACVYSLGGDANAALANLEKYFSSFRSRGLDPQVTAQHITSDGDLDAIRNDPRFVRLLYKHYPKKTIDFLSANEVPYALLLEYLKEAKTHDEYDEVEIRNKTIYWEKSGGEYVYNSKTISLPIPTDEKFRAHPLRFYNCTFKLHLVWAAFSSAKQVVPFELISFERCKFQGRLAFSELDITNPPRFRKCSFSEDLYLSFKTETNFYESFLLDSCSLNNVEIGIKAKGGTIARFTDNYSTDSAQFYVVTDHVDRLEFSGNHLGVHTAVVSARDVDVLKVTDNKFSKLVIQHTRVGMEFDLLKNQVNKLLLGEVYFSVDPVNDIDWKSIDSLKLGHLVGRYPNTNGYVIRSDDQVGPYNELGFGQPDDPYSVISGETKTDIANDQSFAQLMGLYSMFLNLYKNKYDIESYNRCLITMKELQLKRLEVLHESNSTFNSYFRWKLARLMRFYVSYGTDPARAIVVSIYIVIIFGVFYFFFPSDWDVTSKKRLLQNFRDFIEKNEKGYVKPFLILTGGFLLSLMNAITLSLNAFITLGFGNIPTHGVARYVCVLEGFLGWFLLSIFTVALINQVL